jgi:F-type H+-transporting ATPase subunit epsilon
MTKELHLIIVTPEKVFFDGSVKSVSAPGEEGYFQILLDHVSMISTLRPGKLEVVDLADKRQLYFVSGGFLEVSHNTVSLLADVVENAAIIDMARAKRSYERARRRLAGHHGEVVDTPRAQDALHRASERVKVGKTTQPH